MNDRLQQNLEAARTHLLNAQWDLALIRISHYPPIWLRAAESKVCRAIDRAWEAQCMASGSY